MQEAYVPVAYLLFSKGVAKVTIVAHLTLLAAELQKMTGLTFDPIEIAALAEKDWLRMVFADIRVSRIDGMKILEDL